MSSKEPLLVHLWVRIHMCIGSHVCVGGACYMEVRGWSKMSLSIVYFPRRGLSLYPVLTSASLLNQFVLLTPCFCLPSASITVGYQTNMAFYSGSGESNPVLTHGAISWVFSPSFLQLPLRSFVTAARMQLRGCPQRNVLINGPALCCDAWDSQISRGKGFYQLQFQRFQDMVNWPVAFEAVVRQPIHAERTWWSKLLTIW